MPELTVTSHNARIHVQHEGAGTPLLLVHAYPLSGQLWRHQIADFSDTHHVIVPDLRGFGRSSVTPGEVSMRQYADDLAAVLDAMSVEEPVVYCGVSMAGYIGWQFAQHHGDRVAGLFMSSTKARADSDAAIAKRKEIAARVEQEGIAAAEEAAEALVGSTTKHEQPELVDDLRRIIRANDPRGVVAAQNGMASRPDMTEFVCGWEKPLHFVAGAEDTFTTAAEIRELATDANASYTRVEGAGHLVPLEQPLEYNTALRAFLAMVARAV